MSGTDGMTAPNFDGSSDPGETPSGDRFPAADGRNDAVRSMRVLGRLAQVLGVPVETFFETATDAAAAADRPAWQVAALSRAFLTITDPAVRRRCLDFVDAAAKADDRDGSQS